jgi:hypothetical protein
MGDDVQVKEEEGVSPPSGSRPFPFSVALTQAQELLARPRRAPKEGIKGSTSEVEVEVARTGAGPGRALAPDLPVATAVDRAGTPGPDRGRDRRADADDPRPAEDGTQCARRPAPRGSRLRPRRPSLAQGTRDASSARAAETIRRLQEESGARISIDRGAGECVVSGTTEQVILGSAAVKKVIAEAGERGGGGGGGGGGGRFVPPSGTVRG